jgi:hypothetical protein
MRMDDWFDFIEIVCQSSGVYSIQCCRDSICSAETYVDCPSNICFKLGKISFFFIKRMLISLCVCVDSV